MKGDLITLTASTKQENESIKEDQLHDHTNSTKELSCSGQRVLLLDIASSVVLCCGGSRM